MIDFDKIAPYIDLTKKEVAKRQIEYALKIFFEDGDVVSAHTLASAANKVLADIARKNNTKSLSFVRDLMFESVKKGKEAEVFKMLNDPENYFKHADRDSDASLRFYYRATEFMLWDACEMYMNLYNEKVGIFLVYRAWFTMEHQDIFYSPNIPSEMYIDTSKKEKFLKLLPYFEEQLKK